MFDMIGVTAGFIAFFNTAIFAVLVFCPVSAGASFYSGNELLGLCTTERASTTYFEKTYECVAYISGTVDTFNSSPDLDKRKFCIPGNVTISQLKETTVEFLRANPENRDSSASAFVFSATVKAWPCVQRKTVTKPRSSRRRLTRRR